MVVDISVLVGVPVPDPLAMATNIGSKNERKRRSRQLARHLGALNALPQHAEVPEISSSNETETSVSEEST